MHPALQPVQSVRLEAYIHRPEPPEPRSFAMFDMSTWSNLAIHIYTKIVPPGAERKTVLQAFASNCSLKPPTVVLDNSFTMLYMDQQGKVTANSSPMSAMSACFPLLSFALQCSALPRAQGASIDCGNPGRVKWSETHCISWEENG